MGEASIRRPEGNLAGGSAALPGAWDLRRSEVRRQARRERPTRTEGKFMILVCSRSNKRGNSPPSAFVVDDHKDGIRLTRKVAIRRPAPARRTVCSYEHACPGMEPMANPAFVGAPARDSRKFPTQGSPSRRMSAKYMARGSPDFSPSLKAAVGLAVVP